MGVQSAQLCAPGATDYMTVLARLVFGTLFVIAPVWALWRGVHHHMDFQRSMYGRVNPFLATARGAVYFFITLFVLSFLYSLLAVGGGVF